MRRLGVVVVAMSLVAGCADDADRTADSTTAAPPPTRPAATTVVGDDAGTSTTLDPDTAAYVENFEFVWKTVDDRFYDPGFGGVDWDAVHDRYLPRVGAVDGDREFLELVNSMLFELDVSHLFVVPPDEDFVDPVLTREGDLGIHVRLVDEQWIITHVEHDSPAARAGLRPGYLLESVDGQPVPDIAASAILLPPLHERGVRSSQIRAVEEVLHGEPGATAIIGFDDGDESRQVTLTFRDRGAGAAHIAGFPPVFPTLEVTGLEGGIDYIGFDLFTPALATPILDALDAARDAPGLIIDVRGNHGGDSNIGKQLIDALVDRPALLWTWHGRDGSVAISADPSTDPYDGPVVVLVDIVSGSGAELFAGGLQAMGRAVVVGERTSGRLLGGEIAELPMGALMVHPINQPVTADGTVIERRGVIPDIAVTVQRRDLLAGTDPTLRAALDHLLHSADG